MSHTRSTARAPPASAAAESDTGLETHPGTGKPYGPGGHTGYALEQAVAQLRERAERAEDRAERAEQHVEMLRDQATAFVRAFDELLRLCRNDPVLFRTELLDRRTP